MHELGGQRKFWIISLIAIFAFVGLANFIDSGSSNGTPRFNRLNTTISKDCETKFKKNGCIDVYLQYLKFDPETQYLDGRIFIAPPEKFATTLGSSSQLNYDFDIYLDAAKIDSGSMNESLYFSANSFLRAIDFTIDVTNIDWNSRDTDESYPFDRYSADISGLVIVVTDNGKTDSISDDTRIRLPLIIHEYSGVLPNWRLTYDTDYVSFKQSSFSDSYKDQVNGYLYNAVRIERSQLTVLIVGLLTVIFLGGALSMLLLLRSIFLSHKPSSLTGLIWAGSTAFTMIQTRTLMPGNPRLGVRFDLIIFYPSLAICFVSALLMLRLWLKSAEHSKEI